MERADVAGKAGVLEFRDRVLPLTATANADIVRLEADAETSTLGPTS